MEDGRKEIFQVLSSPFLVTIYNRLSGTIFLKKFLLCYPYIIEYAGVRKTINVIIQKMSARIDFVIMYGR